MKHSKLKFLKTILKGAKGWYLLNLVLLFVSTFLSVLSTFLTKILIDILQYPNLLEFNHNVLDPLSKFLVNLMGGYEYLKNNLYIFSIIIIGIAISMVIFVINRIIVRSKTMVTISGTTQKLLFNHIERLPYDYIKTIKNGDILQTCTKDEQTLQRFIVGDMQTIFYTIDIFLIAFTILCSINWIIAISSIIVLPVLFIYSYFLIKVVRKRYRETDNSEALMTSKIEENLSSVRIVKAYNNESYEINDFEKYLDDYKKKFIHWRKLSSFYFSSSDVLVFFQIALSTIVGIYLCIIGKIGVSTVVIATSYVSMIVWPVRQVATTLSNYARVLAAYDRMNILLNVPVEDIDSGTAPKIKGEIEFKNTSFIFSDDDKNTLENINLKINQGETVAILGKTGSGKSTLAYLLIRLFDCSSGNILIDGVDIKKIQKKHLRNNISMVLQEPFLFSKTIYSNLNITKDTNDPETIYNATKIAHIHENILSFKEGYNTQVGEKGVTLSGGQKQRIAIARSLVKKAPILIFDDSLSAVDTETDIEIRTALKSRMKNSTTIIITHRVATAKDADKIVVLENNTISESGTYEELIKIDGLFKRINDIQTRIE